MQAQSTMYTSDPTHQLICLFEPSFRDNTQAFIISTRIFFDLHGMAAATPIPWQHWGPSNTRVFLHYDRPYIHINGNRVLQALPDDAREGNGRFILHLMDFSPLAVTNRRGLGRVVKKPSKTYIGTHGFGKSLTTSLPYVHVVLSDRKLDSLDPELMGIWMDMDRIYMLNRDLDQPLGADRFRTWAKLEAIDV